MLEEQGWTTSQSGGGVGVSSCRPWPDVVWQRLKSSGLLSSACFFCIKIGNNCSVNTSKWEHVTTLSREEEGE